MDHRYIELEIDKTSWPASPPTKLLKLSKKRGVALSVDGALLLTALLLDRLRLVDLAWLTRGRG